MIKKYFRRLLFKWLLKDLNCSYDSPNMEVTLSMHEIWSKHESSVRKLMKIHKGNCIEKYANSKKDAELIRDVIEGLASFILLYYNTVEDRK